MTPERLQEVQDCVKFNSPAREIVTELIAYIKELEAIKRVWYKPMIGIFDDDVQKKRLDCVGVESIAEVGKVDESN